MELNLRELALTLYGEARGEPIESVIAVGCVARNRVKSKINSTYNDIVHKPRQFSCWNDEDPNKSMLEMMKLNIDNNKNTVFLQCVFIAGGIIDEKLLSNIGRSMNYLETNLYKKLKKTNPNHWASKLSVVAVKGHHTFLV